MTPNHDRNLTPEPNASATPAGQDAPLDLSHQGREPLIQIDGIDHLGHPMKQECALLTDALRATGADITHPAAAMVVEEVAARIITDLLEKQDRLVAALDDAVGDITYLAPERFDNKEHEANFHRSLEEKRQLVAEIRVPPPNSRSKL
jgi:hypothetical protein